MRKSKNDYKIIIVLCVLLFSGISKAYTQNGFRFLKYNKTKQQVRFKLINNLIVIPIEINGKKLSFILDTGVNKTILFNLTENDSIGLLNTEKVVLRGLGGGNPVEAILSKNNKMKIKEIVSFQESIYVIIRDYFDLSGKMGTTIHGIIGYNLFKNFIVKINYSRKTIDFYKPNIYKYRKCRRCKTLPLFFYRKKPFIDVKVQLDTIGNELTDVKMLIDSGGSDALWLFEHTKPEIITPNKYFKDILGEGLSGSIYGNRSRIERLVIGDFQIENPTVSFLDTLSTVNARNFKQRNGSIGGNILKRFKVWIDYPNRKITLKKNGSLKKGFNYNMSGLDVVYNGKQLVKEESKKIVSDSYGEIDNNNTISFISSYSYRFKPSYKIRNVVIGSPGDKAGIKPNDIILKINGKPSHNFTLNNIVNKLQEKENKKIRIEIVREGVKMKFEFRLEKRI